MSVDLSGVHGRSLAVPRVHDTEAAEPEPGLHGQHLLDAILSVKTDRQEGRKGGCGSRSLWGPGAARGGVWAWGPSPTRIAYSVAVCPGIRHWGSREAACSGRA